GMELLGHDPFVSASIARENGIRLVSAEELFSLSEFITLHVGLTPQTAGIINRETIGLMKKGVRIVNCARGELVVEKDLAEALESGQVAGAALDVFHEEPPKDSVFAPLENVILTPHIAGSTAEAQEAVGVQIALQVREYLKSGVVQNAVNLPSLTHEEYEELAPYMKLAERLGTFLGQFPKGSIDSISMTYHGRLGELKTELIRNSAIAGVLAHLEQVNRINAASVAAERGIRLHEEKKETPVGGAGTVLQISLHTAESTIDANGAVLHGDSPQLLHLDGIDIEAPLQGTLLAIRNKDVPGVIGRIGTILGEHKINIANFALGRADDKGAATALAVLQIDGQVSDAVIRELRSVEAITGVRQVTLQES
ncbi:MAG TPA: NAD(P)-dependent oxidoreductase, partial [Acidobacteriaceae bacterium]|nr:NAD(P)-dependent oxidoreductase [Acidobacteriaceae bacterium]